MTKRVRPSIKPGGIAYRALCVLDGQPGYKAGYETGRLKAERLSHDQGYPAYGDFDEDAAPGETTRYNRTTAEDYARIDAICAEVAVKLAEYHSGIRPRYSEHDQVIRRQLWRNAAGDRAAEEWFDRVGRPAMERRLEELRLARPPMTDEGYVESWVADMYVAVIHEDAVRKYRLIDELKLNTEDWQRYIVGRLKLALAHYERVSFNGRPKDDGPP